jgi:hypothetical protein
MWRQVNILRFADIIHTDVNIGRRFATMTQVYLINTATC